MALEQLLHEAAGMSRQWRVRTAGTAALAAMDLQSAIFDVVLLDVDRVTDPSVEEALAVLLAVAPTTPIVLLTNNAGWDERLAAMQRGASDVLHRGAMDIPEVFLPLLDAVLDRARLRRDVDAAVALAQHERELRHLIALEPAVSVTASMLGQGPMRERSPDLAHRCVADYRRILVMAVEQRDFHIDSDPSHELRSLAGVLVSVMARPSDITWLHQQAVDVLLPLVEGRQRIELIDEARVRAVELMGHVAGRYRAMAQPGAGSA